MRGVVSDPCTWPAAGCGRCCGSPGSSRSRWCSRWSGLLLFGALFENVVPAPNGDYIAYLTPGIVVMSALFSSGWAGMGFITDAERGVMDRLLVSPVRRGSVMTGSLLYQQVTTVVQTAGDPRARLRHRGRFPGGVGIMLVFIAR
jgi:ABC-2 type transport system permease protein